jgi:hypothetical protein
LLLSYLIGEVLSDPAAFGFFDLTMVAALSLGSTRDYNGVLLTNSAYKVQPKSVWGRSLTAPVLSFRNKSTNFIGTLSCHFFDSYRLIEFS